MPLQERQLDALKEAQIQLALQTLKQDATLSLRRAAAIYRAPLQTLSDRLLSCIGKGLERTVARRIAWTAMTHKILSPQHEGALPKRSAADLTAAFTHDTEAAWARGQHVTMATLDV
jgi:hypothetical protein